MASQRMNRIMALLGISLAALLGGCGANPTGRDVVGTWANPDGAELTLEENGQFSARSLSQPIFFWRNEVGPPVGGKGTWRLEKRKPYWEVRLGFDEISGRPASREIGILVSGSGASAYLYLWKGEEGEGMYKLYRKSPAAR